MGDYNSVRTHHDYMSFSIYNFLDNLLSGLRPSDTLESDSQNRDQVNTEVKPGGYSEDIFIFLSDREKEEYNCSVCYSVVKDVHQCRNGHKFCYSCIYVWSTCNRSGADCCPVCRCDGVYARNDQLNEKIGRKRVKCVTESCNWRGFLRDFNDHEHRIYDFRELNTTIELPFINGKESSYITNSTDSVKIESSLGIGNKTDGGHQQVQNPSPTTREKIDGQTSPALGSVNGRVARTSLLPRRLVRANDNNIISSRTSVLRPSLNNYSRTTALSTRCPTYRQSVNNARLSRLSRNGNNGPTSSILSQESNSVIVDNPLRPNAHNEYTQTSSLDTSDLSSDVSTSMRESLGENLDILPRGASGTARRNSLQLPAINQNNLIHVPSVDRSTMEYRRLAPTFASRRNNFGLTPHEGREQLAMMLILLTSDLEERVTLNEHTRDSTNNSNQIATETTNQSILDNNSSSTGARNSVRLGRSRLQEFRNLNRRLSEVANSLDRLIASTSRDGTDRYRTTFNHSPESSTSNSTSDVDDESNFHR